MGAGPKHHQIIIVGGGAAGVATAASLLVRKNGLDIAIIEPSDVHYYQPGWTLVGAGVFTFEETRRPAAAVAPKGATWIKGAVGELDPARNRLTLESGEELSYDWLVLAPGLTLHWEKVAGLEEALGHYGVASNYRPGLAPYTYKVASELEKGRAIFTQPPMPIKCAGAPQKAMYLSCDIWRRNGRLADISVDFCNAGAVLFGVSAYVPALMEYVKAYGVALNFGENLVAVDGPKKIATFEKKAADGRVERVERAFDMLHVCPPQGAPAFVKKSPLANEAGWAAVDPASLRSASFPNVFAVGDVASCPNAKTAAAARKQAPIAAVNLLAAMEGGAMRASYDGYGSCPLTVERGKIVLAEFGYDGKLLPTFPEWVNDGLKATRGAWLLKEKVLPTVYWDMMLRGREWLAAPQE